MAKKVVLSWSSGKDSAWTLLQLQRDPEVEVVGLLTTVNAEFDRVAMHSTRRAVLEAQAAAVGLPLRVVPLPWPCTNEQYEAAMAEALAQVRDEGVSHLAFGDLFLEEIRAYREQQLEGSGLEPFFPIWGAPTAPLADQMIAAGLEAVLTCVDPKVVSPSLVGRRYDRSLLEELPDGVDPCGENGEFHTCVVAGPMLRERLSVEVGEKVERGGFWFADLLLREP